MVGYAIKDLAKNKSSINGNAFMSNNNNSTCPSKMKMYMLNIKCGSPSIPGMLPKYHPTPPLFVELLGQVTDSYKQIQYSII